MRTNSGIVRIRATAAVTDGEADVRFEGGIRLNVLILSCSTGQGHNSAAEAVREALSARGAHCTIMDHIALKSERAAKKVADTYIRSAVLAPHAFGATYRLGDRISRCRGRSPVYLANKKYASFLAKHIGDTQYDAVVATHLYPAETLTYMRRRGMLHIPFYAVITDYTCSPFWEETRADLYFTPSEAVSELFAAKGVPAEKLFASGIPVKQSALERPDRQDARAALGVESRAQLVVVMGGSMGGGRMIAIARELLRRVPGDAVVAALCGRNESLARRLQRRFAADRRLRIVGYTDNAILWMQACDVLMTKPGGITSTEAAVAGVPLLLTAPIPGCETQNAAYFFTRGIAWRAFKPAEAAKQALALLNNELARHVMRSRQQRIIPKFAADGIAKRILNAGEACDCDGRFRS